MGIYLRESGIFWMRFVDGYGRAMRKSTETKLKTEAQAIYEATRTKVREGKFFDIKKADRMLFEALVEKALAHERVLKGQNTKFLASTCRPLLRVFGKMFLEEINPHRISEYQRGRLQEVGKNTINRELAVLRKIFNLGIRWDYVKSNPVKQVDFFKIPRGRIRFLDKEEQARLLEGCHGHLKDIVTVALRTGMRRGELLGLTKGEVDFKRGLICLSKTKTGAFREIPMIPAVEAILKAKAFGKEDGGFLFSRRDGTRYTHNQTAFENARSRAGIKDFRFHDLRHTYASDLVSAGVDIFTVSKLLGHANVKTTMIYAHLAPNHRAAEMERYQQYLAAG